MNTSSASNPFTGLKGALAGLMSGGWVGLLLGLLFRRRVAPMLAALEGLFAQWKAGTLPLPAAPARPAARSPATARRQPAAVAGPRARRTPAERCRQVIPAAVAPVRPAGRHVPAASRALTPAARAPYPPPRDPRCRKNAAAAPSLGTPKLSRYSN
jgi:hypothetical protein